MLFRSDRKSTRLNSSHLVISYAVFCLKKKRKSTRLTSSDLVRVDAVLSLPQPGVSPVSRGVYGVVDAPPLHAAQDLFGFFFFKKRRHPRHLPLSPSAPFLF